MLSMPVGFFMNASAQAVDTLPKTTDSAVGKMVDGKKDGIWRTLNKKGIMVKKEKYKAGELIYYIIYNDKRKIIETRDRKGVVRHFNPCNC